MASRIAHHTTIKALSRAKNGFGTLDEVAARFHFEVSKGTLSRVLNGQSVSEYAENDIRLKLGLDAIRTKVAVACSTCGDVHGEGLDCHGKPVVRVQIVSGPPRNRKRYHRPCLDDAEYARFLEWRQTCG
jgi:hypothetical protein